MSLPPAPSEPGRPNRRDGVLKQISTFGAVSVATTILDFTVFNLLIAGDVLGAVQANTISYSAGIAASYLLNKHFTFVGGGREKRTHEIALFVLFNIGGLALNNLAVGLVAGVRSTLLLNVMKLLAGAVAALVKFLAFKRWVYPMTTEVNTVPETEQGSARG